MLEHRRRRWDVALALAAAVLVVGLWLLNEQPWRPTLVVWCCGSNYESQADFGRQFGRRNGCKTLVVGAPVQYLLELTARARQPDLIVGRAGPGWPWLQEQGLLARGPEFFAVDPYVIVVPPGNEGEVTSVRDLAKGLYVAAAPYAMRPKGKCVAALLGAIGDDLGEATLAETYYLALRKRVKCGRQLPRALKQGRVFAAITQRSQTTHPDAKGLQVIVIDPRPMVHMEVCRATVAQAVGVPSGSRRQDLANRYVDDLLSPDSREILQSHGYYHVTAPESKPFKPLLQVFVPTRGQPYQDQLARELMADGQWEQALRRWLKLLHIFGPSPYDAKARYHAGYCALQLGLKSGAWHMWSRCVRDYPRKGLQEWGGPLFEFGLEHKDYVPEDLDEKHWADKARQALAELGGRPAPYGADWPVGDVEDALAAYVPKEIRVIEGDLEKGSRRNMAIAEDELLCGVYDQALTDYLKVYALNAPNDLQDEALFRAGQCVWLMGNHAAAVDLWEACKSIHTGDPWAELAGRMLYLVGLEGQVPEDKEVPEDAVKVLATEITQTGLLTAQALALNNVYWDFQARNFSGALQECMKVVHAFYAPPKGGPNQPEQPDLRPHARYWAGIACCWLGHPDAAVYQWRTVARDYPSSEWPAKAQKALAQLQAYPDMTADQREALHSALAQPLPKAPTTAALAAAALPSGGMDADLRAAQVALTDLVPDKGQAAVWHHIALEQFVCHDWKAALYSFLKVLTVVNVRNKKMNKWQDEALYFTGACLERMGLPDRASARRQQLLDRYPDSPWAARARGKPHMAQAHSRGEVLGNG